jgi:hypothetical protein
MSKVGGIDEDYSQIDSRLPVWLCCVDRLDLFLYVTNTREWRQNLSDPILLKLDGVLSRTLTEGDKPGHISWATFACGEVIPYRGDGGPDTRATAASQISIELCTGIELSPSVRSDN